MIEVMSEVDTFKTYVSTANDMEEVANIISEYVKLFGPISAEQRKLADNRLIELEPYPNTQGERRWWENA